MSLNPQVRSALADLLETSLLSPIPDLTPRHLSGAIQVPGKVTAVVGMRRSGKTTLVHQLRRERLTSGTPRSQLPYLSFEDERLTTLEATDLGFLLEELGRSAPQASEARVLWSFDEIQLVPGWERFVRRLVDHSPVDVVVTGSSAALLSREIGTALRGRAWTVPLFPFSFSEALAHQQLPIPAAKSIFNPTERGRLEHAFRMWLTVGGFPEAQRADAATRHQLLRDYVDVAMLRDVIERHQVSNPTGLRWLVRQLLGNAGGLFSIEKFHQSLRSQGVPIARDTLHQYLAHLEDCFLVRVVWMESSSERQRMVNPRKIYPVDPGLIPLFDRTGRTNTGHALETAVLIELERRRCEVTYVRTEKGREVDFLARDPGGDEHLIQVCTDASDPTTAERELRALAEASRSHPRAHQWLLTATRDGAPTTSTPSGVIVTPAYAWMLGWPTG